jgi:acetyl esterase/lipase
LQLRHGSKDHRHDTVPLLSSNKDLDPDIRRFQTEMNAAWARHGDLAALPAAQARRVAEEVRAPWTRGGPTMSATTDRMVPAAKGTVLVRFHDPTPARPKPVLVYLHGGGWTFFSINTHDRLMREYAARAGVVVAGVDYALSPEAKYPVALEQVMAVVRYLAERGHEVGIDPARIAIGGDSAGANLALAAALRLRDESRRRLIRGIVLNYGVFDRESSQEAREKLGGPGAMLTAEEMESYWRNYLRDESRAGDPYICPLRAEFRDLPPVFLVVPDQDLLSEQSIKLAEKLREAKVPVKLELYRGAIHSFLEAVSIAPLADRALSDTAAWLRQTLSSVPA